MVIISSLITIVKFSDDKLDLYRQDGNNFDYGFLSVEKLLPPSGDIEQYATVLKKNDVVEDETQVSVKQRPD